MSTMCLVLCLEFIKIHEYLGAARWAKCQLVKCPTLDFGSGHNLRVMRWSPILAPCWAWIFFLPLSAPPTPPPRISFLSLSKTTKTKQNYVPSTPLWGSGSRRTRDRKWLCFHGTYSLLRYKSTINSTKEQVTPGNIDKISIVNKVKHHERKWLVFTEC